jgi:ribosome biogenesis GTPase
LRKPKQAKEIDLNMTIETNITAYGWNEHWKMSFSGNAVNSEEMMPGRVVAQFSNQYRIATDAGIRLAEVSGKFAFCAKERADFPAVGDWVVAKPAQDDERAVIHGVLPRRTAMIRKAAGTGREEQVIGANVDILFVANALNQDFNVRKIERFLIAAWESGAQPVVVLTKADLCADADRKRAEVELSAPGVPVHAISAWTDAGMKALQPYLSEGRTLAVVGSSGAGKSTLLNRLSGSDSQRVQAVREDDARGRHTTTHRELFVLPSGALMMDTPGMRELQLWDADEGRGSAFSDIEELALQCRFRDCRHESETGCAVKRAIETGELDKARLANYKKTGRELAYLERKAQAAGRKPRR